MVIQVDSTIRTSLLRHERRFALRNRPLALQQAADSVMKLADCPHNGVERRQTFAIGIFGMCDQVKTRW